jgi:hypothetical protein
MDPSTTLSNEQEVVTTKEKEVVTTKEKEVVTTREKEVVTTKEKEVVTTKGKEAVTAKEREVVTAKETEVVTTNEVVKEMVTTVEGVGHSIQVVVDMVKIVGSPTGTTAMVTTRDKGNTGRPTQDLHLETGKDVAPVAPTIDLTIDPATRPETKTAHHVVAGIGLNRETPVALLDNGPKDRDPSLEIIDQTNKRIPYLQGDLRTRVRVGNRQWVPLVDPGRVNKLGVQSPIE